MASLSSSAVADVRSQRLRHARDDRYNRLACQLADVYHRLRQRQRIRQRLHQRTRTCLDIQHNAIRARREFLAHDGRGNQRQRINGGCYIAQSIERLICRGERRRLPDDRKTDFLHLPDEPLLCLLHGQTGDGFELIQRTAGVPQPAPAHLRHRHAARRHQRRQNQRRRIAHAAGGMLVNLLARNRRQVTHVAAVAHGKRQVSGFLRGHAIQANRHQQRRQLIIRNGLVRRSAREKGDFLARQWLTKFLLGDNIQNLHTHPPSKGMFCLHYTIAEEERKATAENLHLILIKNTEKGLFFPRFVVYNR